MIIITIGRYFSATIGIADTVVSIPRDLATPEIVIPTYTENLKIITQDVYCSILQ